MLLLISLTVLLWVGVLIAPWRPYAVREILDANAGSVDDLADVVALVPARNESNRIAQTLTALAGQGSRLKIVVVDDQSTDQTTTAVSNLGLPNLVLIHGAAMPGGWTGKVWAQSQAEHELDRPLTLLMDADIELTPGILPALKSKLHKERAALASLMVELPMKSCWEKLLIPAFVYFFKLLYPFALANAARSKVAAAAGGCILLETERLRGIGGFARLRGALIDDCTLARLIKHDRAHLWIGLTRAARSVRRYSKLTDVWNMVARTAFTQLRYSMTLLALCTLLMGLAFAMPVVGVAFGNFASVSLALVALSAMMLSYLPTIRYYRLHPGWALSLPVAGLLFLAMTWTSAFRHWWGEGALWRGRAYGPHRDAET